MEYRKLEDLRKLENNPRKISSEDFQILVKSIKDNPDYFEARPLLLSDRTGELVIIAGNQRYDAAKYLGLKEVPTYLLTGLTRLMPCTEAHTLGLVKLSLTVYAMLNFVDCQVR